VPVAAMTAMVFVAAMVPVLAVAATVRMAL
jgi:hypothetical protein